MSARGPASSALTESFRRLAAGDLEALEDIWDACSRDLYGLALWRTGSEADAADVVQEVFVRLASRRARLEGVRDPRGWLLTVAHRAAIDLLRKRKIRRAEDVADCPYLEADSPDPETRAEAAGIRRALEALPPEQREVLHLRHFSGLSWTEIGRVQGVPTFTAASRHRLALGRLRRRLDLENRR